MPRAHVANQFSAYGSSVMSINATQTILNPVALARLKQELIKNSKWYKKQERRKNRAARKAGHCVENNQMKPKDVPTSSSTSSPARSLTPPPTSTPTPSPAHFAVAELIVNLYDNGVMWYDLNKKSIRNRYISVSLYS